MQFVENYWSFFGYKYQIYIACRKKKFHNFIIDKALHPEIEMHIKDPCKEEILVNDLDLCYFL